MRVVKAGFEIMDDLDGGAILRKIERVARTCYKSEDKITDGSAERMVRALIKSGHEAMLEHFSFSVKFIVDRGVSHELVRHRVASFAQESTRYCNYGKADEITVIEPFYLREEREEKPWRYHNWALVCAEAEEAYMKLIEDGATPQEARAVLPNSLKTEVVMTANLREWRHFFKLRALGTTGKPHPQMVEVALPLLEECKKRIPVIFDDLVKEE
jgi:thymidylate synthase (FAD)